MENRVQKRSIARYLGQVLEKGMVAPLGQENPGSKAGVRGCGGVRHPT